MSREEKVIHIAKEEVGYLEKKNSQNLDSKTDNSGSNNYTKYARDLYPALQGQPWCDMFVDWCFVKAFGEVLARQMVGGGFSAYTPTSAGYYKEKGLWRDKPRQGDQVFFRNSVRIYHTGIVERVTSDRLYTIEGNTSGSAGVVANGGGVWEKSYLLSYEKIAGYGRPDWSLVEEPKYTVSWNQDQKGWWYADTENSYLKSCWKVINGHKYYFNQEGYALTGWQELEGKWYYFEPRKGHPLECALYRTNADGVQDIGAF
ncbi:MAG: CHAP domain-containing protein [Hungatella sp.]|nr:CHAP domain-containing protein [Hungatella sp.]